MLPFDNRARLDSSKSQSTIGFYAIRKAATANTPARVMPPAINPTPTERRPSIFDRVATYPPAISNKANGEAPNKAANAATRASHKGVRST